MDMYYDPLFKKNMRAISMSTASSMRHARRDRDTIFVQTADEKSQKLSDYCTEIQPT